MSHDARAATSVVVSGLAPDVDLARLRQVFEPYGSLVDSRLHENGQGSAWIRFSSQSVAAWVVENLDGNIPQGLSQPVTVRYASSGSGKAHAKGGKPSRGGPYESGRHTCWDEGKGAGTCSIQVLQEGLRQAGVLPGETDCTLYVAGLPHDTTDLDLYKIFGSFGAIHHHKGAAALQNEDGICRGIGFVTYVHQEDAKRAIETLDGTLMPDGRALRVSIKRKKDHEHA